MDIAASYGAPIKSSSRRNSHFIWVEWKLWVLYKISHGNGTETVYGHCSKLIAKVGQKVSQGQVIAK